MQAARALLEATLCPSERVRGFGVTTLRQRFPEVRTQRAGPQRGWAGGAPRPRGCDSPLCVAPRVRSGTLPGSGGLCPDPGGVLPQSNGPSRCGPRAQAVWLPAQGTRTVEPFFGEGRNGGVCPFVSQDGLPAPQQRGACTVRLPRGCWELLMEQGRGAPRTARTSSREECGRGCRGQPRKVPSLEPPVPPARLGVSVLEHQGVAGEEGQVAGDTVLCPGCAKSAPSCSSGWKVGVQERPAPLPARPAPRGSQARVLLQPRPPFHPETRQSMSPSSPPFRPGRCPGFPACLWPQSQSWKGLLTSLPKLSHCTCLARSCEYSGKRALC